MTRDKIDETSALMEDKQRKRLAAEAKKRNAAGNNNTLEQQQKALTSYHAEKRKAEEMLLMAPMSQAPMREELEYEEASARAARRQSQNRATGKQPASGSAKKATNAAYTSNR